jgi:hypothetical protein
MANSETCYYCGRPFIQGSDFQGNRFGVKTNKFSVVHPVCSKKCEIEFNNQKKNKSQEQKVKLATSVNSVVHQEELQTSLKSVKDITISDINTVVNEIVLFCKEKGFQQKSFYLNNDNQIDPNTGSKYTEELKIVQFEINEKTVEILKNRFIFESQGDWDLLAFICAYIDEQYSPSMSSVQIQSLSESIYSSWKKNSSIGCFGSVAFFLTAIICIYTFI